MKKLFSLALIAICLSSGAAFAQFTKPDGVPQTVVQGNVTIAVFTSAQTIDQKEFTGVFEQHSDQNWYYTGLGTTPSATMAVDIAQAGGYAQYLSNVAMPIVNADILSVYYGQSGGGQQPPPAGSDPMAFLNYYLATGYIFKTVNNAQQIAPR